jgi:hypothetical protein
MLSPIRVVQLIAALGVISLTACGAESVTAPGAARAPGARAGDVTPCGYSVADGKC